MSYLSYDQFEKEYLGKAIDFDGLSGVQCVDLVDQYLLDTFGITDIFVDSARDFYNNFESYPALVDAFDRVPNTSDLVVQKGDIVVWGGGPWGHAAVGTGEGDIDIFVSIEQNTKGKHESTRKVKHTFNKKTGNDICWPVLGVLRPKDQKRVLGTKKPTFKEYKVAVTVDNGLNVRVKPGMTADNKIVKVLKKGETGTIIAEKTVSGQKWGRLSDKSGWICLAYTRII